MVPAIPLADVEKLDEKVCECSADEDAEVNGDPPNVAPTVPDAGFAMRTRPAYAECTTEPSGHCAVLNSRALMGVVICATALETQVSIWMNGIFAMSDELEPGTVIVPELDSPPVLPPETEV